jgi:hypothetical protein
LLAEFCGGRQVHSTYEYYQPNMMARQLGCGQVPPKLFLHEFLKPGEDVKESIHAKRIFEYTCSKTVYIPNPFMPITLVHLSFTYWWQEFHDHIFSVPMHPICFELMPDFQPVSEVTCLSPFYICFQSHSFLLIRIHYFFCRI